MTVDSNSSDKRRSAITDSYTSMGAEDSSSVMSRRRFLRGVGGLGALALLPSSKFGHAAPSSTATSSDAMTSSSAFVHPGLLHTQADFDRMRAKVSANASPWIDSWQKVLSTQLANVNWKPSPSQVVYRGSNGSDNWWVLAWDVKAAYLNALHWKISGDVNAANAAVRIMNAWSSKLQSIWWADGHYDGGLVAGIQGYQFANVGEIMRSYSGWAASDFANFQKMMKNVFYPMNSGITNLANPSSLNIYSSWDLCAMAAVMAIGVLCDDHVMFNAAVTYFKQGLGNGALAQMVYYMHPGYLGQTQESGRDQGHNTLSISLVGVICEMAWNQGVDLYGYSNNRVLAGCEYVAKGNLTKPGTNAFYSVPFTPYSNPSTTDTAFATWAQGIERPEWALIYNHYVNRRGMAAPYSQMFAAKAAPEGGSDYPAAAGWDEFGYGSLTFARDPIAVGAAPSGLTAVTSGNRITLSWWGTAYATSYTVKRSTISGGPYQVVAKGISDLLTYTDVPSTAGVYYYVVTAMTPSGETAPSNQASGVMGVQLDAQLPFNDATGTTARDTSGHGHNGILQSGAGWVPGRAGHGTAVVLNGNGACVGLPTGLLSSCGDFTIAAWVYWNGGQAWARIFDIGSGMGQFMMLTPCNDKNVLTFTITLNQGVAESIIEAPQALPSGQWVHVAVTLFGQEGSLYVNGTQVGSNSAMLYTPYQLGETTSNWIGRSQFSRDPTFNGKISDFRIYRGALSGSQISALVSAG